MSTSLQSRQRKKKKDDKKPFDYSTLPIKEFQRVGVEEIVRPFEIEAGRKLNVVMTWLPRLLWVARGACATVVVSFALCCWYISHWPDPLLLFTDPDGNVRCADRMVDTTTGEVQNPWSGDDAALCTALQKYGAALNGQSDPAAR